MISTYGLSAVIKPAAWSLDGAADDSLAESMQDYSHTIMASGGFDGSTATLMTNLLGFREWSTRLGWDFTVFNPEGSIIWNGFLDHINFRVGPLSISIGPLLDVSNRVSTVYQTVIYNTNPPIGGEQVTTTPINNTDSQAIYPILESILQAGGDRTAAEVADLEQAFLDSVSFPGHEHTMSLTGGKSSAEVKVMLRCKGYVHLLKRFMYKQTAVSGQDNLSDKLTDVVDAEPNGVISWNTTTIDANTLQVLAYEAGDRDGLTLVKGLTAMGDVSANRYTFGVYEGQVLYYRQAPSDIAYGYSLFSDDQRLISRPGGTHINPWDVRPAEYVFFSDILPGAVPVSPFTQDLRVSFIEQVSFSMPDKLNVNGGRLSSLAQKLAQLGLGGVG